MMILVIMFVMLVMVSHWKNKYNDKIKCKVEILEYSLQGDTFLNRLLFCPKISCGTCRTI